MPPRSRERARTRGLHSRSFPRSLVTPLAYYRGSCRSESVRVATRVPRVKEGGRWLALCFIAGAVLGTALDAIHAYGDVEAYPDPALGRLGWFVPLEFGLAGLVAAVAVPRLDRRVAGRALVWPIAA